MASFLFALTLVSLLFLLHQPHISTAKPLTKINHLKRLKPQLVSQLSTSKDTKGPIQFFEVTKPIELSNTKPCSHRVLSHDFGFTYGSPPVQANYTPPLHCQSPRGFSKIVLEWKATCRGTQFDRIFGVWLGGVELLRSCTAEPTSSGIVWTVDKDITRYYSLLVKNETQTLAVFLGNVVDATYTGVYHVNLTMNFYPAEEDWSGHEETLDGLAFGYRSWADLVMPISRNLPLNDGLWFEISGSVGTQLKEFKIPRNAYRAVLEVYVSFHENDEFWYSNLPNDYIAENKITDVPGNGPFREIVVSLDDEVAGAVWPFTVIYTGGFNPLLWRPISGIGSFNLPSYDIEITPFLGKILDGKTHTFAFNVTNALNVWFVDANLHIWLDKHCPRTEAKLLKHSASPLVLSQDSDFEGLNGKFLTTAKRRVLSIGSVKSSFGIVTTHSVQDFSYSNSMVLENDGNTQIIDQTIRSNETIHVEVPFLDVFSTKSEKTFPLYLYSDFFEQSRGETYLIFTNLTLGFNEDKSLQVIGIYLPKSSLRNEQTGLGYLLIQTDRTSASASTTQVYDYEHGNSCYLRNISSTNYDIAYDEVNNLCKEKVQLPLNLALSDQGLSNI